MSLFSALTVAVGGLAAQSTAIGNISDNLANTSTIAYKAVGTSFESLVTVSNSTTNDPGGVLATPDYENSIQGTTTSSSVATYMAISGSGYFAVKSATTNTDGTTSIGADTFFTRRGDFTLDADGYLVNGSGYFLTGYEVKADGTVDSSTTVPVQISQLLDNPVSTATIDYAANLPASADTGTTTSASTIVVYDSLGNEHELSFVWDKTGTNAWQLTLSCPDNTADASTTYDFVFNSDGTIASITDEASNVVSTTGDPATVTWTGMTFAGANTQSIALTFGTIDSADGTTQYADTTLQVTSLTQDGVSRGSFEDISIDKDGYVTINYSNGRSRTIYQVPIVQFYSEDSLQRISGDAYRETVASGTARYSTAGTLGAGTIVSSALEASNVDIASEFTRLITAQRVYSANAKVVTTADSMLQDVINIIR